MESENRSVETRDRALRRVLLVSAAIGEGHDAAAGAVGEAVRRRWPACETSTVDSVRLMGRAAAALIRSVYRFEITRAPGVYQFFYDALWRHPWFVRLERRIVGAWCGRALLRRIRDFDPDLVVSTYAAGTAALGWLRRTGRLETPTVAYVLDFAAHPFWVSAGVDTHLVMHEVSIPDVRAAGVEGPVRVGAPPVRAAFRPGDAMAARARLDLRADARVCLVTGGGWGVGNLEGTVDALLELGDRLQVVVACGRNDALLERLRRRELPRRRLVPLGFVDAMPDLMAAADVVIGNAGGITVLEAFAADRPVLLFDPIAGQGRASAEMLERAGLSVSCSDERELAATVRRLCDDETARLRLQRRARWLLDGRDVAQDMATAAVGRRHVPRRLSATVGRAVRWAAAAVVAAVVLTQATFMGGNGLTPPARGAVPAGGRVAVAVAGPSDAALLTAVADAARHDGVAMTFLLRDGVPARAAVVRDLARQGFDVEFGSWRAVGDPAVAGARPLVLRDDRPAMPGAWIETGLAPGTVVELVLSPRESPARAVAALRAVVGAARRAGLRIVTVAELRAGAAAASHGR